MDYLFQISIGPVQSFITSARRTRDLDFGSWLLSEFAKAAAKQIVDLGGKLIFPAPTKNEELEPASELNVANKIVAEISISPQTMGNKVYKALLKRLHDIRDEAFINLSVLSSKDFDESAANKQIDDLIEYFWAALPYPDNNDTYEKVRERLEALMAARKNTRNFQRVQWGNNNLKSSIDGQMESVIVKDRYPNSRETLEKQAQKASFLYKKFRAGPSEQLSGVDLLKRLGPYYLENYRKKPGPASTSHIAAIPFLQRLETLQGKELVGAINRWKAYLKKISEIAEEEKLTIDEIPLGYEPHPILGSSEGSLLFEERLVDVVSIPVDFRQAKEALRTFYKFIDESLNSKARPYPYYAIIHADGDRMGQVIRQLAQNGQEKHRELSRALDTFANKVSSIVRHYQGMPVYSGGDDVLAFLPLHTVLECTQTLAKDFREKLGAFKDKDSKSPTLSIGVAIVHHLHPLSDALNIARAAERKAKDVKDVSEKNALAIIVRKRSGGEYEVADHWGILDVDLMRVSQYFYENMIPEGTAYELREMLLRLTELEIATSDADYQTLQKVIDKEAKRILQRKLQISQEMLTQQDEKDKVRRDMYLSLEEILDRNRISEEATTKQQNGKPSSKRVEQFVNTLLVAQLLADVKKIAKLRNVSSGVEQ